MPGLADADAGADETLSGPVLADDDFQLALYLCYELHYRGLPGVDDGWEWSPDVIGFRRRLERRFEAALEEMALEEMAPDTDSAPCVVTALRELAEDEGGPSLSRYMAERGTVEQMQELCVHRSAYQLKEADPHTWVIPRLAGDAKAAVVRIQHDEYGGGMGPEMHSELFAETMAELGLDSTYGAYLDLIPGATLATVNLVSMLGLHRRLRAGLVGHLALFEMTSVGPMTRYGDCLRRLGFSERAQRFYDAHVEADARHEGIALDEMVTALAAAEPSSATGMVRGARWLTGLEARFSRRVLSCWSEGATSLRRPLGSYQ